MSDYKAMYLKLMRAQCNAIDALDAAREEMISAHREAEEILLSGDKAPLISFPGGAFEERQREDHEME